MCTNNVQPHYLLPCQWRQHWTYSTGQLIISITAVTSAYHQRKTEHQQHTGKQPSAALFTPAVLKEVKVERSPISPALLMVLLHPSTQPDMGTHSQENPLHQILGYTWVASLIWEIKKMSQPRLNIRQNLKSYAQKNTLKDNKQTHMKTWLPFRSLGFHGYSLTRNFVFQGYAGPCVQGVPMFWHVLQLPSSDWTIFHLFSQSCHHTQLYSLPEVDNLLEWCVITLISRQ
jgi:hypothetical protein